MREDTEKKIKAAEQDLIEMLERALDAREAAKQGPVSQQRPAPTAITNATIKQAEKSMREKVERLAREAMLKPRSLGMTTSAGRTLSEKELKEIEKAYEAAQRGPESVWWYRQSADGSYSSDPIKVTGTTANLQYPPPATFPIQPIEPLTYRFCWSCRSFVSEKYWPNKINGATYVWQCQRCVDGDGGMTMHVYELFPETIALLDEIGVLAQLRDAFDRAIFSDETGPPVMRTRRDRSTYRQWPEMPPPPASLLDLLRGQSQPAAPPEPKPAPKPKVMDYDPSRPIRKIDL